MSPSPLIQWVIMIALLITFIWKIQSPTPRKLDSRQLKHELEHRLGCRVVVKHTRERQYILAQICDDLGKDDAYLATAEFLLRDDPDDRITELFKRRLPLDKIFQSECAWEYLSASRPRLYKFFQLAGRFLEIWSWVKQANFNKEVVSKSDGDYLALAKFLIFYKHETNDAIVNLFKIDSLPSLVEIFQNDAVLTYLNQYKLSFFELANKRKTIWSAFKRANNKNVCDDDHDEDYLSLVIFLLSSDHKTDEIQKDDDKAIAIQKDDDKTVEIQKDDHKTDEIHNLFNVTNLPSLAEICNHGDVLKSKLPGIFDLAKRWPQIFSTLNSLAMEPLCDGQLAKAYLTFAGFMARNGADFKLNSMPKLSVLVSSTRLENRNTVLHQSVQEKVRSTRFELLNLLASGWASELINEENSDGDTALHLLCKEMVKSKTDYDNVLLSWLLKIPGLDVNIQNHVGDTPAHIACRYSSLSSNDFKLLLEDERVDWDALNDKLETPRRLRALWKKKIADTPAEKEGGTQIAEEIAPLEQGQDIAPFEQEEVEIKMNEETMPIMKHISDSMWWVVLFAFLLYCFGKF